MKLVSWNVNGIRACAKKGFLDFLEHYQPDICCLQETKAQESDLEEKLKQPSGYHAVWQSAEKKGYSGVAVLTKQKPLAVHHGIGIEKYDSEGRVLQADYEDFSIFSVYFPNGQKNDERLQYKLDFYQNFFAHVNELRSQGRNVIICGDYNTAHKPIDLANPKANQNYSGFLPIEREWMDKIVDDGYVDTFRAFNNEEGQYTWWTYRYGARKRNVGWRIDYFFVNESFMPLVKSATIHASVLGSDHCPIEIELDL